MTVLFLLVPLSILLATFALLGYIWACRSGQFDDLSGPAQKLVFEEKVSIQSSEPK